MKETTKTILESLSGEEPRKIKSWIHQLAVLMDANPTRSILTYSERENDGRNIKILRILTLCWVDGGWMRFLKEEFVEKVKWFLDNFSLESYLLCEKEALEYIKERFPNSLKIYKNLLDRYLVICEWDLTGILFPKKYVLQKNDDNIKEDINARLESEVIKYKADINTDEVYNESWKLHFSEETLEEIRQMEARTGYTYNTTMLKKAIWLTYLADYQLHLLENWDKYDDFFFIWWRRVWKSFLLVYIALRELMIPETTIVYIAPSVKMLAQPFTYLDRFVNKIGTFDKKIRITRWELTVRNDNNGSIIRFITSDGKHGVKSLEGQLVIVDEAAYTREAEYLDVASMAEQQRLYGKGKLISISTINEKTPKNRFYDGYILWLLKEEWYYSMRVPIAESPFRSKKAIKSYIKKCKNNEAMLKSFVYAEFPDMNSKIDEKKFYLSEDRTKEVEKVFVIWSKYFLINNKLIDRSQTIILGYDPAKKVSKSWLTIYTLGKDDKQEAVINLIWEWEIEKNTKYINQVEYLVEIYKYIYSFNKNIILAIDENWIGTVVYEMLEELKLFKIYLVHAVQNGGWLSWMEGKVQNYKKKNKVYYVKYDFLQELPTTLIEKDRLKWLMLPNISNDITAINNIWEDINRTLQNKIDHWNSMCIACFTAMIIEPKLIYKQIATRDLPKKINPMMRILDKIKNKPSNKYTSRGHIY